IGSHAARALKAAGYEVIIYDNLLTGFVRNTCGFQFIKADISDSFMLESALSQGVEAVMHFAASAYVRESVLYPRKYFDNNVQSGLRFLNTVVDRGIKFFVFSSSCAVYGVPCGSEFPITEEARREPVNPYGASKLFFENA